jgi:tetratricopeptide (TPR) repeat protein
MKNSPQKAWLAYEERNYEQAEQIWLHLLEAECDSRLRHEYQAQYAYVLVALERYDEARSVYRELYTQTQDHQYLHRLAEIEREAKNFAQALHWLTLEQETIAVSNTLARAANFYELGKVYEETGELKQGLEFAKKCLNESSKLEDGVMKACAHRLMGDVLRHQNIEKACDHYEQASKEFQRANELSGVEEVHSLLVELQPERQSSQNAHQNAEMNTSA